ncbi:hypothetical protein [Natrinema pellirubrum]|nr:hypothetical protein [Natrinema pellirubrum]
MNRRAMLSTVGAVTGAVAGCLDDGADEGRTGSETDRSDDDDADRPDDDGSDRSERGGEKATVRSRFEEGPVRPECKRESERITVDEGGDTREYETAATIPYPEPPTEFGTAAVVDFVREFENAYVTHEELCNRSGSGRVLSVYYGVQDSELWGKNPHIVFLYRVGAVGSVLHEDGAVSVADAAPSGVVYAVDETGAARVEYDDATTVEPNEREANAPDPLAAGDLVTAFD